ncbi:putative 1-phosphatidylinositol-3-phosphate 5-kinase FAB1D [Salvia miltiorrhiza]|uniref:putative 1-phosphatidylinositol-3-phosphate 5-kinase FAB1D n=1 Tax=Salvia miltiorrhiza TaxID=226208 RepID=UPI0025AB7552|nr:putative 1-phosphatidylinositol-3-phosphate 5-kinase FAB1D [Salvia miltiorrhiza]
MPSLIPSASLESSHSSLSSCSDISSDVNFYDRPYVEDSSQEDVSLKGRLDNSDLSVKTNGFHQNGNLAKQHILEVGRINSFGSLREVETAEVPRGTDSNVRRVSSSSDGSAASLPNDEGNAEFWLPPEPEDWEDDVIGRVASYDDDDDECGDGATWARPSSLSSFEEEGSASYKFREEKVKAMDNVKNGKFMALVSQLVKSVGVNSSRGQGENWVDIVTSLSWEAAAFVKPNTHEGKAMDPDGYVKIKCIATGLRSQSQVFKGLVFKKHAAHKHMPIKCKNPRLLLIHGSLDLTSGGLSSFDSMQQQEKSNLKTIVDMIENCNPNVILVEKSVSRDIQESILANRMTLVFDMKLHRLDRVARCIGSPILSTELALGQKLRQCESFHIERFVEEHDVSNDGGKRPSKTLMFLEGCPSRLGCTIVLMGASSDELKRIKCVIRCAVVMAYHFMLETSFLLDQTSMFSTISPCEVVDLALNSKRSTLIGSDETNMCGPKESDARLNTPSTLAIPISNGFHQNDPENLMSSSETVSGLSLSTSVEKVMNNSFPFFTVSSERIVSPFGFNGRNWDGQTAAKIDDMQKDGYMEDNSSEFLDTWNHSDNAEDHLPSKDGICAALDSESILVLLSSRNASRGTICEKSHFSHIKFYRSFDVPLGKFLRDNLLNQGLQCKTCGETPDVHSFFYAHHDKQLTIQVRHLPAGKSLPGETEGKLWMWSRCSLCQDGSSKSTKRVLISTAAHGLSFGKFLQLSFSDVSSFNCSSRCGHSFHKDFLYFFGLGPMVAVFKYSSVATCSVSLPPQKMEFSASVRRELLKKDSDDVYLQGISMFIDIEKSLKEIETRYIGVTLNILGSSMEFSDIILMLKQEKSQFEVETQCATQVESEVDAASRLLSLNTIRLELLLKSCIWDRRLHALLSSDIKVIGSNSIASVFVEANECPVTEIRINGQVEGSTGVWNENGSTIDGLSNSHHDLEENPHCSLSLDLENDKGWIWAPFADIRREYMEDLQRGYLPKIESFSSYAAESVAQKLINDEGSRLHIPLGANGYIVSDYEDEFSSIIACALTLLKDFEVAADDLSENAQRERVNDSKPHESSQRLTRVFSLTTSRWPSFGSSDSDGVHSPTTNLEDSHTSSFDGLDLLDSTVSYSASHPEVSMGLGRKRKYSVICLFASPFRQLRDRCCPSEVDFIASLSRCRNWDAKGGKSKSLFAKTLDDRLIIKEIKRTELDSFMTFATNYFEYMNECYELGNQTCLAKILGIYQVTIRSPKNGKETRHDLLVMENLSFGWHISRQYDLKGALHARLNTDEAGEVLLDQNFVNDMSVSPLYVCRKSKRNLQRAVYNDTNFLNTINVMDYSLLVGVDSQRRELVCGIIDYLRQYTWDKQLENWVKSSLVVPKNQLPTIISPIEYKKRFRKFISTHFLTVPDHWCSHRSSDPCKVCGTASDNGLQQKKRGSRDDSSCQMLSQKQGKREPCTLKLESFA